MAAHAAVPTGRRITLNGWGAPVTIGVLYGLYAATNARQGGPTTLGQLWLGIISAVVLAVGIWTLRRYGHALPRELRGAAWGSLVGIAVGFLYSLTGASVFSSSMLGLMSGGVAGAAAYYLFYTHEDATGHPAPY
ncbi:hypothetical protein [Streptomyces tanashiensis]|uniref:Integral membrane protein n=1 Tax=Streptomyces tanashiensis TaxID=67367 RepID=A0ABY6R0S8_9ACTN|nr:hypothetical protein [Streptomyces tanashiensis]UZX23029.1 hypothetical protein LDH80_20895 [Streptomyces tanashiensis]GGY29878.1 hypothetical protein GCM10010299_40080 [Streptomyces tanashiensis]